MAQVITVKKITFTQTDQLEESKTNRVTLKLMQLVFNSLKQ